MAKLDEESLKQINDLMWRNLMDFYSNFLLKKFATKEDLGEIKSDISEIREDISDINRKLDNVCEKVTDLEVDHEKRLKRVEKKLAFV